MIHLLIPLLKTVSLTNERSHGGKINVQGRTRDMSYRPIGVKRDISLKTLFDFKEGTIYIFCIYGENV